MKIWLAILAFTLAISINLLSALAQESDSETPVDRGPQIAPTQEQNDIPMETRSWEDMERYERSHPNPPKPSPIPTPTPHTLRFWAYPTLGAAPPLNVSFGAVSPGPLKFDDFTIDYGDGSRDSLQQQCFEPSGTNRRCGITAKHKYTSFGTFPTTLLGNRNSSSQILGTLTIAVGNPLSVTKAVGDKESSFLIQKINRDSVEGLWYQKYPVESIKGTLNILHIGDDIGYGCEGISDKLTNIDFSSQKVTFTVSFAKPPFGPCPRCLAGNTLIDTPSGFVLVKDLQVGMSVWTTDNAGQRISGVITKTSKVLVSPTHQMVHLVLSDGRQLSVSPGHPTIDGRKVGDLAAGDSYNDASVVSTQRASYNETATYDILPSGDTGFYWANGILIGSTLR